jgi:16S rRNA processing protein RimM
MSNAEKYTVMGKITTVYGVKGWVKVFSYSQPKENICQYDNWILEDAGNKRSVKVLACKPHGNGLVAHLDGSHDRDQAKQFCGSHIVIPSAELPDLPQGEFYWHQLQGLKVFTIGSDGSEGQLLGKVSHLMETGSNDVLVVKKCKDSLDGNERLIPYLPDQVVKLIDLEAGLIEVDWDADF